MHSLGNLFSSRSEFQKACVQANRSRENFKIICEVYKSFLDGNFAGKFCVDGHCRAIFMVEISFGDLQWGATPKKFYSKTDAEKEAEVLKLKYPFISEFRVVTRNIEDEIKKD